LKPTRGKRREQVGHFNVLFFSSFLFLVYSLKRRGRVELKELEMGNGEGLGKSYNNPHFTLHLI